MKNAFILFLFLNQLAFAQKKDTRLNGLDKEIETIQKKYNAAGLSIAIVENNQIVYSKGFGYRDQEQKLPVTENTVFPIGSITKSFTASLIGILEDEHQLSIKDKPSIYLPKLQFYNERMDNLITISDLLCHKSGIGNADGSYTFFPPQKRLDIIPRLKYIQPEGEPNNSWIYSNMGYALLGTLIETVSNASWENYLQDKLVNPLHMNTSSTSNAKMFETTNYSLGYGWDHYHRTSKVLFEQLKIENPVGGINSTSKDLANYMMMWLNKGSFEGKNILSKNYVQEAISLKAIDNGSPPEENDPGVYMFGYGYGWKVNSLNGHYKVSHGGNISGFSSQLVFFPTDHLGIVVLTNQHNSLLPYIVADMITNHMLKLPVTNLNDYPVSVGEISVPNRTIQPLNKDKKTSHDLIDYCGKYNNPGYGTFEITKEGDNLFVNYPVGKFQLEHQYYDVFVMKTIKEISQYYNPEFNLNFSLNTDGTIERVKINFQNQPVEFIKEPTK